MGYGCKGRIRKCRRKRIDIKVSDPQTRYLEVNAFKYHLYNKEKLQLSVGMRKGTEEKGSRNSDFLQDLNLYQEDFFQSFIILDLCGRRRRDLIVGPA